MKNTLTFDPIEHRYTLGGLPIPGVTSRIGKMLPDMFAGIPKGILEHAAERGTAIHRGIELLIEDDLDWSSVHPEVRPYIEAWQAYMAANPQIRIVQSEVQVFSKKNWYAGTTDHIAYIGDDLGIIDLKSSLIEGAAMVAVRLQTAAYGIAWDERNPRQKHKWRMCLQLRPDEPAKAIHLEDKSDYQAYLRGLAHVNWIDRELAKSK